MQNTQASYPRVCTHEPQRFSTKLLESQKTSNEYLAHFLWLKFGDNTSETTLLLNFCLEGCIFTSLFGFIRENCTTHATLCINFLLFGCFRLNFLKIYATIFGIYEGKGCMWFFSSKLRKAKKCQRTLGNCILFLSGLTESRMDIISQL